MPLRASRATRLLEEPRRVPSHLQVFAHCTGRKRMYELVVGGDVDVRTTRFFTHFGEPSVGMFLK